MDVHVRFWNASQRITRYLTSVFMGHATVDDIENKLLKALEPLPLAKILQVSMDRANVNLKFFRGFQEHLQANYQVQCLDLGTCCLHAVYNALRAGVTASKWGVDILLSSLSALFQDPLARREDYSAVTGNTTFPLKFVPHRWVENVPIIERALSLWSDVKMYIESARRKELNQPKCASFQRAHRWVENVPIIERALSLWPDVKMYIESARRKEVNQPKCASFQNLLTFSSDPLVLAKLNFALGIALIVKPFLTEYQTDQPLVFFLARDLETIVRKLLTKFVKCSVLSASTGITGLLKINIEDANTHTTLEKVDISHAAEQILKNSKVGAKDAFTFKMECKQFLVGMSKKILEKSPLRFALVRGLSSLDPRQMCTKPDQCLAGLKSVLNALIAAKRLSDHQRDSVLAEYAEMLQMEKHKLRLFEKSSDRLDNFFLELLKFNSSYAELWRVVELLLVLSHAQATVERGFIVNRQVCVENLKSLSYVLQRVICDAVDKAGSILNVPITKELRASVSAARQHYHAYLEAQKKQQLEEAKKSKRGLVEDEIDNLRKKKVRLEATVADLTASADDLAAKAEATGDILHIGKSNSLRKTAKSKKEELININKGISAKLRELS